MTSEERIEAACQAIYREHQDGGYWPVESERTRIGIALEADGAALVSENAALRTALDDLRQAVLVVHADPTGWNALLDLAAGESVSPTAPESENDDDGCPICEGGTGSPCVSHFL